MKLDGVTGATRERNSGAPFNLNSGVQDQLNRYLNEWAVDSAA